jgi:Glucanosyltransferase
MDVLATKAACARDVKYFQRLGINTIAITAVDPKVDHTGCMELLQAAGIYVFVVFPIPSSNNYDNADSMLGKVSYFDESSLSFWFKIVDTFNQYYNIAGFLVYFSGDEGTPASLLPSFRANVRDIKAHIKANNYRDIPVGAVAGSPGALTVFNFMTCGSPDTAIDFYAVLCDLETSQPDKIQSWTSMFDQFSKDYRNASIPIFLSYGHGANESSKFDEVPMLYRAPMAEMISGVILAEWIPDDSGTSLDSGMILFFTFM